MGIDRIGQCTLLISTATATTMPHRALLVDEILRDVTARVASVNPPTAIALACCARFLEEPTLSALWKIQDTLPTLIKTLPPDSWELHIGEVEDTIVRDLPLVVALVSLRPRTVS